MACDLVGCITIVSCLFYGCVMRWLLRRPHAGWHLNRLFEDPWPSSAPAGILLLGKSVIAAESGQLPYLEQAVRLVTWWFQCTLFTPKFVWNRSSWKVVGANVAAEMLGSTFYYASAEKKSESSN